MLQIVRITVFVLRNILYVLSSLVRLEKHRQPPPKKAGKPASSVSEVSLAELANTLRSTVGTGALSRCGTFPRAVPRLRATSDYLTLGTLSNALLPSYWRARTDYFASSTTLRLS